MRFLKSSTVQVYLFIFVVANMIAAAGTAGQPSSDFADDHTVALWLFDEPQYMRMTLSDAGTNLYDLRLLDSGKLVPGRFGNALQVSRDAGPAVAYACASRVYDEMGFKSPDSWKIRPPAQLLDAWGPKPWTFECWIKPEHSLISAATIFELGYPGRPVFRCQLAAGGKNLRLEGEKLGEALLFPIAGDALNNDAWHHIALVCSGKGQEITLFIDGHRQGSSLPTRAQAAETTATLKPGIIGIVFENQVASPLGLENPVNVKASGQIDFYWGETRDLAWLENWRGMIQSPVDGEVELWLEAQDGGRLTIGDKLVIDGWTTSQRSGKFTMHKGKTYPFQLEFRQMGSTRQCRLQWRLPGADWTLVPGGAFSHGPQDEDSAMKEAKNVVGDRFYLSLGSGWLYDYPLQGQIDEVRVSDIARYARDFTPATHSRNYGPHPPAPTVANGLPLLFDGGPGTNPIQLGTRKHVFIDDVMLEARNNVRLTMIPPTIDHPTDLRNSQPWESKQPASFGDSCFYDDDGTIRFMYNNGTMWRGDDENNIYCIATTKDGLHFEKPQLKHIPWKDQTSNNIIVRSPVQGRFFKDPNPQAPAAERYKFGAFNMHRGVYLFTSPDGLVWRRNETILAPFDVGGGVEPYWDDQRGTYVAFIRNEGWTDWHAPFGRAVARCETTEPFKPWPFQPTARPSILTKAWTLPSITTELPTAFAPKETWNAKPQYFFRDGHVYRSRAHKYAWAPDTYVSFHWRLYGIPDKEQRQSDLAVSRDGVHWTTYEKPYFPNDVDYEGAKVIEGLAMDGLVRRGDELWQYAELRFSGHRGGQFKDDASRDVMMRYKQRLDGFVALETGEQAGWFLTRPFIFDGHQLELNVAAKSPLKVAILDERENAIPGFSLGECDPIQTDSTHHVVTWKGQSDVSRLAGRTIRLRMELTNARIFAFQFTTIASAEK